ncbi:MAG: MoaD/ThiS family protein [Acidilobaceae archaeon]
MTIKIRVYATLRERLGWSVKDVEAEEGVKLSEVLESMPELWKILVETGFENYVILVNGHNYRFLNGLNTIVEKDSLIDVFPPAGGGLS